MMQYIATKEQIEKDRQFLIKAIPIIWGEDMNKTWEEEFELFRQMNFWNKVSKSDWGKVKTFIKSNFIEKEALVLLIRSMQGSVQGLSSAGGPVDNLDEAHGYNQFAEDLIKEINK